MDTRGFDIARQEEKEEEAAKRSKVKVTIIKSNETFEFLVHGVGSVYGPLYKCSIDHQGVDITVYADGETIATIYNVEIVD